MQLTMNLNNLRLTWNRETQTWVSEGGMHFTEADFTVWGLR